MPAETLSSFVRGLGTCASGKEPMLTMPKFRVKWAVLVHNAVILLFTPIKECQFSERISFDRGFWVELKGKCWQYYFTHFTEYAAAEFAPSSAEAVVLCYSTTAS